MEPELIYSTPFLFASLSIFIVALFTFAKHKTQGAWTLVILCLAGSLWTASEGMLYLGFATETNLLITYIQYLGIASIIPLTLIFILSVFGFQRWINPTSVSLLMAIAASIILLVWTNPLHHKVFSSHFRIENGPVPMLGLEHGYVWWMIIGYHYALTALMGAILLWTAIKSTGHRRSQAIVVLAAVGVVWVANAVYVTGKSPVPNMDLGPLAFILVAISLSWGFFRYHLLDLLPIAKAEIFMALSDPIFVIDGKNRVLEINPAAETLFDLKASDVIARDIDLLSGEHPQLKAVAQPSIAEAVSLQLNNEKRHFDLRTSLLKDKRGEQIGRVVIVHDITERERANEATLESERLQGVLEMAGAVCHDLSQPVMALLGYSDLICKAITDGDPLYTKAIKLSEQSKRLKETTHKLMRITRYETRKYLGNTIVDIDKSSAQNES